MSSRCWWIHLFCLSFMLCLYGDLLWELLLCLGSSASVIVVFGWPAGCRNVIMSQLLNITLDGCHLTYWYSIVPLLHCLYISDNCVWLDPPLHFGSNHTYGTRLSSHFCNIFRYSTTFGQKNFRSKAVTLWNSLPCSLFDCSFSCHLYKYLQLAICCIIMLLCVCNYLVVLCMHVVLIVCCCIVSVVCTYSCYCM